VRLIPHDENFFRLFTEQAENIRVAAQKLVELFEEYHDVERRVAEIKFIERKGDEITHGLMMKLNKTFITPFDGRTFTLWARLWTTCLTWSMPSPAA
jgi:uncharacterized protein